MGFINLNGQSVHTSTLSSTNSTWSNGKWSNVTVIKTTYHILDEDVEVNGFKDGDVSQNIALINVLGKIYYDELKKQNVSFPPEIEDFLSKKFITIERDRKIDDIIK